MCPNVPLF